MSICKCGHKDYDHYPTACNERKILDPKKWCTCKKFVPKK